MPTRQHRFPNVFWLLFFFRVLSSKFWPTFLANKSNSSNSQSLHVVHRPPPSIRTVWTRSGRSDNHSFAAPPFGIDTIHDDVVDKNQSSTKTHGTVRPPFVGKTIVTADCAHAKNDPARIQKRHANPRDETSTDSCDFHRHVRRALCRSKFVFQINLTRVPRTRQSIRKAPYDIKSPSVDWVDASNRIVWLPFNNYFIESFHTKWKTRWSNNNGITIQRDISW